MCITNYIVFPFSEIEPEQNPGQVQRLHGRVEFSRLLELSKYQELREIGY